MTLVFLTMKSLGSCVLARLSPRLVGFCNSGESFVVEGVSAIVIGEVRGVGVSM